MDGMRQRITALHCAIDELTEELRGLQQPQAGEVVRRAEEAGAALARLEWAFERVAAVVDTANSSNTILPVRR
jgi:hypothetical protein